MTVLPRFQPVIVSGIVALAGIAVAWASYTQEPADAFLFPRLISTVFAVLGLWAFAKALMSRTDVGDSLSRQDIARIAPGLLVALIYIFWAAKTLGFYTAGTIAFFVLLCLYDPAPHAELKSWIKRIAVTAGFLAVMYGLFDMLLGVFTPQEILF